MLLQIIRRQIVLIRRFTIFNIDIDSIYQEVQKMNLSIKLTDILYECDTNALNKSMKKIKIADLTILYAE